jgi:SET family sugar efflux transporter-like MFS transporter
VGVAALVLLGAPAAVGTPLLFGYIRHSGASRSAVVRTRALFSAAWFVGPPVAALIIAGPGPRTLVLAIGLVGALNVAATSALPRRRAPVDEGAQDQPVGTPLPVGNPTLVLVLLVVIFAGLQATNTAGTSIITLFTTETLHLSPVWGGVALGVAAALEVPALLALARMYRKRQDDLRILGAASVVGIAYYLGVAVVPNGTVLICLQLLNAMFYAVVAGVGLTGFRALIAGPGRASGMLANSQRIGAILAGPLVALGSLGSWGLRTVFLGCAVVTLAALGLMQVTRRVAAVTAP